MSKSNSKGQKAYKSLLESNSQDLETARDELYEQDEFNEQDENASVASILAGNTTNDSLLNDNDYDEEYSQKLHRAEKAVEYTTLALSLLLLGGSVVFWWVVGRYLIVSPYALNDPIQMKLLMISCALFPIVVTAVQWLLRKPTNSERWLTGMCVSGVLCTLTVIIAQAAVRKVGFTIGELPTLICCAVSGCALPSIVYIGIRRFIEFFRDRIMFENSKDWQSVKNDVLSLTNFDI